MNTSLTDSFSQTDGRSSSPAARIPSISMVGSNLQSPFISKQASDEEVATPRYSEAESHHVSRGWISECLWWIASWQKTPFQSEYEVLFINGSNRFGTNSVRLSGR